MVVWFMGVCVVLEVIRSKSSHKTWVVDCTKLYMNYHSSIPEIHKIVPFLKGKSSECFTRCFLIIGSEINLYFIFPFSSFFPSNEEQSIILHSNLIKAAAAKEVEKCECNFSMFHRRILLVGKFNFNEP